MNMNNYYIFQLFVTSFFSPVIVLSPSGPKLPINTPQVAHFIYFPTTKSKLCSWGDI